MKKVLLPAIIITVLFLLACAAAFIILINNKVPEVSAEFRPEPLTKAECEAQKTSLGIKNCYGNDDYWAGAVKQCGGIEKIPSNSQLTKIASKYYEGKPKISAAGRTGSLKFAKIFDDSEGYILASPPFLIWTNEEHFMIENTALTREFSPDATTGKYISDRNSSEILAVCLK